MERSITFRTVYHYVAKHKVIISIGSFILSSFQVIIYHTVGFVSEVLICANYMYATRFGLADL